MGSSLPSRASLYEVSPRDGLQNERRLLSTAQKRLLIQTLIGAGLKRIETTSFVSPRWVPQLADADELMSDIAAPGGVRFSALCPNSRGLERAIKAKVSEVAVFLSASETHNLRNTNRTIERSLQAFAELVPLAQRANIRVRAYVSTVFGCPYEGAIDIGRSLEVTEELLAMGCYQVSLGDTIGVADPLQVERVCELFSRRFELQQLALHLHDTRGTALANAFSGLRCGVTDFDTSIGGIGGCPYAPGASGNLATEDLAFMLDAMEVDTGLHLGALVEAGNVAEQILGRSLPGRVHRAGLPKLRGRTTT